MTSELYWLTLTALMTSSLWLPYILVHIVEVGLVKALFDGEGHTTPVAAWAARLKKAHSNTVENLVVFATLVIVLHITGTQSALTAQAAMVFFFARLLYFVVYGFGVPLIRTLLFALGWACTVVVGLTVLGII